MQFGDYAIDVVSGGYLRIDGGSMFGMVPRTVWQNLCTPDDQNRVLLATNCLLIRGNHVTVLVDTGYGSKSNSRLRKHHGLEDGHPLLANLLLHGVKPGDVDIVILTHLHFDHAGGATVEDHGSIRPTFPNAKYYIQQAEWDDATANMPELAGAYFSDDFVPLHEAGVLHFLVGDTEVLPGITAAISGGHTRGHQIVWVNSSGSRVVYPADLCPYTTHLKRLWTMAYDQFPLVTRRAKFAVLQQALESNALVVFDHDPDMPAAYLKSDGKDGFAIRASLLLKSSGNA